MRGSHRASKRAETMRWTSVHEPEYADPAASVAVA